LGIEEEHPLPVEDAGAGLGRRHQPAQQGRDALGVDGEFERREGFVVEPLGLAGLHLQQLVRIDGDRVGLHRRGTGDRAGDDLALGEQALHPRLDEALTELVEVEEAHQQGHQAGEVEHDDPARQARRGALHEHAAEMLQPGQDAMGGRRIVECRLGVDGVSLHATRLDP
jgi:hypothetical protein